MKEWKAKPHGLGFKCPRCRQQNYGFVTQGGELPELGSLGVCDSCTCVFEVTALDPFTVELRDAAEFPQFHEQIRRMQRSIIYGRAIQTALRRGRDN